MNIFERLAELAEEIADQLAPGDAKAVTRTAGAVLRVAASTTDAIAAERARKSQALYQAAGQAAYEASRRAVK